MHTDSGRREAEASNWIKRDRHYAAQPLTEMQADRFVMEMIKQPFPHCDPRILHAPSSCEYCDMAPEWQALRLAWGIAFTNEVVRDGLLPDPATAFRGATVNSWPGNRAYKNHDADTQF